MIYRNARAIAVALIIIGASAAIWYYLQQPFDTPRSNFHLERMTVKPPECNCPIPSPCELPAEPSPIVIAEEPAAPIPSPIESIPDERYSGIFDVAHTCELSLLPTPFMMMRLASADPPYNIFLHPLDQDRFVSKEIAKGGLWEPHTQMKMKMALRNEENRMRTAGILGTKDPKQGGIRRPIYVDVGANIGAHAAYVTNLGFEVHAFEPAPHNFRLLQCSMAANFHPSDAELPDVTEESIVQPTPWENGMVPPLRRPRVRPTLNNVALGEHDYDPSVPRACMESHVDNQGHSFLNFTAGDQSDCKTLVPLSSLDEYDRVVLMHRRITFLKIDAEGFEAHVLAGAKRIFAMRPPNYIYMEFNPRFLKEMGKDPVELLRFLGREGYSFNRVDVIDEPAIAGMMDKARQNSVDLFLTLTKTIFD